MRSTPLLMAKLIKKANQSQLRHPRCCVAFNESCRSLRTRWRTRHSALFLFLGLLSLLRLLCLTLASLLQFLLFSPTLSLLSRLLCFLTLLCLLLCFLLRGAPLRFLSSLLSLLALLGLLRTLLFCAALRFLGSLLSPLALLGLLRTLLLCAALRFGSDLSLASILGASLSGLPLGGIGLTLALLFLSLLLCGGLLPSFFGTLPLDALRIFGRLLCLSSVLLRLRRLGRSLFGRSNRARGNDGLGCCRRNRSWSDDRRRLRRWDRRSSRCRGRRQGFWLSRSS